MLRKPIINTLVQILGKGVGVGVSLVTIAILTRNLGERNFGYYALITSLFVLLDSLADFGTKIIGVREIAKEKESEQSGVWWQIFWLRIILAAAAFGIGIIFIVWWQGLREVRWEAFVALLMIWWTVIGGSLEILFQGRLRMDIKVAVDAIFPLLFLVILLASGGNLKLMGVFGAYVAARAISVIGGIIKVKQLGWTEERQRINKEKIKAILKETWPMGVYLIVFAAYDRAIDSIMIERYLGVREVAWYALAYKVYSTLLQPAYYFVNSIFPIMSRKVENKGVIKKSLVLLTVGAGLVIPIVYLSAPWMIEVLAGSSFEMSVRVLRILLIGVFFSYLNHFLGFRLISRGGQKSVLGLGLAAMAFNLTANIIIIPRFGVAGAAGVTVATEGFSFLMMATKNKQIKNS